MDTASRPRNNDAVSLDVIPFDLTYSPVDPVAPCGCFGFRLCALRLSKSHNKIIEPKVRCSSLPGQQMPLRGLNPILAHADARRISPCQPVLGDGITPFRSQPQEHDRGLFILRHTFTIGEHDGIFHLSLHIARIRRALQPRRGLGLILGHAFTCPIKTRKIILGLGMFLIRCLLKPEQHLCAIGSAREALGIDLGEVIRRKGMPLIGRDLKKVCRFSSCLS